MRSSETNLRANTQLRLLQVKLDHGYSDERTWQRAIEWFNSVCESVTSKFLVVALREIPWDEEMCKKMQDTILALNARTETLSVYLSRKDRDGDEIYGRDHWRERFPALYETGIVTEKHLSDEEAVCRYFLTSKLLY